MPESGRAPSVARSAAACHDDPSARPADQGVLRGAQAPGPGGDAAGREPRGADRAVLDLERRGDRDERELVGGAIAHLEIARARGISAVRHLDRDDQLAGVQLVLEVGRGARQPIEALDRQAPLSVRAAQDHDAIERHQCDREIRGVGGDAMVAGAKDGVATIDAVDGGAARSGIALVASCIEAAEIGAAHALQEVAADRGHVAQLRRGALDQGFDDQRLRLPRGGIGGHVRHPRQRAEHELVPIEPDVAQGEAVDVDQLLGPLDLLAHQVDQRRAACEVAPAGQRAGDRVLLAASGSIREGVHGQLSPAVAAIAATIPG